MRPFPCYTSVPCFRIIIGCLAVATSACSGQSAQRGAGPEVRSNESTVASSAPATPQKREVACGATTCDLTRGQICCAPRLESQQASCVAAERAEVDCMQTRVQCDDSRDCQAGEACCYTFDEALDTHYVCGSLPCARGHEMCTAGSCAEGFTCHGSSTSELKRCHFAGADVACGKSRCNGTTPVCAYLEPDAPSCISREESHGVGSYECDDQRDCGPGYLCVLTPVGTSCMGPEQFDTSFANATITCDDDGDCPSTAFGKLVCRPYGGMHPGLRGCLAPE